MPPKGSSRKRAAPPADTDPTSRKRSQRAASEQSSRQTSVNWGPDDDQSRHHVPPPRGASPSKASLRAPSRARRAASTEHEHDGDDAIARLQRHRDQMQRDQEIEADLLVEAEREASRHGTSLDALLDDYARAPPQAYPSEDEINIDSDDGDSADEKYNLGAQSTTATAVQPGRFRQRGDQAKSRTATTTQGGHVLPPSANPRTGGESGFPTSPGQPVGGGLPSLSFREDATNKEGKLQAIFAPKTKKATQDVDKDEVLAQNMSILTRAVVNFASKYFSDSLEDDPQAFFDELLLEENKHLVRYLGCLAIAGDEGEQSWVKLLTEGHTREALVIGVLGRALKEHVFADLWFGGKPAQKTKIDKLETSETFENLDGFSRTEKRAEAVKDFVASAQEKTNKTHLRGVCSKVASQLDTMLQPFLGSSRLPGRQGALFDIVYFAGRLSRIMRQAPDVVYYWPPTFKDEEFEPSRMECLNLKDMILKSPYEKQVVSGIDRAVVRKGHKDDKTEAIVQVVCFPGLVAYRQYGGETGRKEMEAEKNRGTMNVPDDVRRVQVARRMRNGVEEIPDPNANGFRSRVVCKSVVYLTWGKQRLLTREAGTSAHIDAVREGPAGMKKYEDDYKHHKELFDILQERVGQDVDLA